MSQQPKKGTWTKCPQCGAHVNQLEWGQYEQCPHCGYYLRLSAVKRIEIVCDANSFEPTVKIPTSKNGLNIPGYSEKLVASQQKSGLNEAILAGQAEINQIPVMIGVMDSHFMMGTLNTIVGKVIREMYLIAARKQLPLVLFIASGGARMQEGIFSLLQMNTVLAAKRKFDQTEQVAISVLTDPTMGGVSASFAFKNDIVVAEKNAQIGFAGQRVIKATSTQPLPKEFQKAEDLLSHGLVDGVLDRQDMKTYLGTILKLHQRSK
ncbi:acetyl-CoA carboxylase carboxyltransferase subunit beta [Paucilactobacillus kaifaensis]|uniref:acetyl-CoA carboxylase carboxyltransferase subunit beta n=1 Tax=Paucilactobacillus kaifaensis TaxID=2559921 RepID=UPI0010F5664C|nr:acetyl-CoA carboxylase carboxyltransferase subunit beta [Paucilactobacillus kaifaensis]